MGHWREDLVSDLGQRSQKESRSLHETQTLLVVVASKGLLRLWSSNLACHYNRGSSLAAWREGQSEEIGIILPLVFLPSLFFLIPLLPAFSPPCPLLSSFLLALLSPLPSFPHSFFLNRQCIHMVLMKKYKKYVPQTSRQPIPSPPSLLVSFELFQDYPMDMTARINIEIVYSCTMQGLIRTCFLGGPPHPRFLHICGFKQPWTS